MSAETRVLPAGVAAPASPPRAELPVDGVRIGVVIPCYRVARHIEGVIRGIPPYVSRIIVVDDKSPDDTYERVRAMNEPRVVIVRHERNGGVGAAMRSGFQEALRQGLDVVVKMDGDGQMDPEHLPRLLEPILEGRADMTKGNRYVSLESVLKMPFMRIVGNTGLSFLVKAASGYWRDFDPVNGYLAIRCHMLELMNLRRLADDYFFESSLLVELGIRRAVVKSVPMPSKYEDEESSLSILRCASSFPPRLLAGLCRRLLLHYYVRDFSAVSIFLAVGIPLALWGLAFGSMSWIHFSRLGQPATAGVVMLAALPFLLGVQMILQAIVLDIGNAPQTVVSPPLQKPGAQQAGVGNG